MPGWVPRGAVLCSVTFIAFVIIASHRPDALLNPQFLAEDGTYFYGQAYNLGGLRALGLPVAGYLVTSARLAGLIAMFFPLSWGPLVFNTLAILIQVLPVTFFFTSRFDALVPNRYARALIALLYVAMPNSFERDAAMTYSQWHIALLAFLVLVAARRSSRGWRLFDAATLLLAGLSGPFCVMLLPIVIIQWWRSRDRFILFLLCLDVAAIVLQSIVLLTNFAGHRAHGPLGVDAMELARIVGGQLFLGGTLGMRGYSVVGQLTWWSAGWLPLLIAIGGTTFTTFALRRAPVELRLLWLFGALILAASLISPVTDGPGTYWQRLAHPTWNLRYEFVLILAWFTTLVWLAGQHTQHVQRRAAVVLLALTFLIGIPFDWHDPPFTDYHFQAGVAAFDKLPRGASYTFQLNPVGANWVMTLIRH